MKLIDAAVSIQGNTVFALWKDLIQGFMYICSSVLLHILKASYDVMSDCLRMYASMFIIVWLFCIHCFKCAELRCGQTTAKNMYILYY